MAEQFSALANEAEIVERAKTDDRAFEILYDHYFPKIYGYTLKRTGNKEIAEDLVSSTFLKVFCHLKKYRHQGFSFGAWVYRIATNNLTDHYRRQGRRNEVDIADYHGLPTDQADAREQMEDDQNRQAVKRAMEKMSRRNQEILQLKFFAELSNIEIAETLGIKANHAGVLVHRALNEFRERFDVAV